MRVNDELLVWVGAFSFGMLLMAGIILASKCEARASEKEVPLVCVQVAKLPDRWETWRCWPKGYTGVPLLEVTWQRKAK